MRQTGKVFINPICNAGDSFNNDLLTLLNVEMTKTSYPAEADLFMLGGTLSSLQDPKYAVNTTPLYVWGTGFIFGDDIHGPLCRPNLVVRALRGKLSKEKLSGLLGINFPEDLPLADPGLLASYFAEPNVEKRYAVGFIPHFREHGSDEVKYVLESNPNLHFIDITRTPREVIKDIQQCHAVLSASLHGLIFSDSLGIPNCHVRLTEIPLGGLFKFRDYYSSFDHDAQTLTMNDVLNITAKEIKDNYSIEKNLVEEKKVQLMESFPNEFRHQEIVAKCMYCFLGKNGKEKKMENVFVSVIMPVFNAQDTIEESINSVLSQTLKNIELICIDDGSSDLSMQIIKKYAAEDERVIAISQPNKGSGAARNAGIDIARGEYICFMDSDDYYPYGDTLEVLYNTAADNNVNICGGSFSELKDGKLETKWNGLKGKYSFDHDGITFYKSYQFDYGYQRFIYDREFLNRNNIRFPDYRRFQDPPFFVKAMIAADKFYAMKRTSYVYRVGGFDRVVWTQEKLLHMLSGLTDLLKMSSEHRLKELHNQTITRVLTTYMKLLNENRNFLNSLRDKLRDFVFLIDKNLFDEEISKEMFFHKLLMIAGVSLDEFLNIKTAEEKNMTVLRTAISSLKSCCGDNDALEQDKPLVTVVIPVYNVEEFIGDCLSTVIDQTYGNLEILCVNDGSPDDSVSIISEYQKADKRIVILNKENGGLSSARNYGIEHASGKYIVFLDSDDYYEQNALKRMVETAESNHADLVHFNARTFYESAEMYAAFKHYSTFYQRKESYYGLYENGSLFGKLIEKNDFKTAAWLNFARTDYIRSKNINFYEGIIHEDNLFSPLVLIMAEKCVCLDEVFYVRRIREDSIITKGISLNNVVGLFTCAAELARFNQVSNLSFEISEALKEWIHILIRKSFSWYVELKKEYGADTSEVTGKLFKTDDKVLFELLSAQIIKEDTQKSQDKRSAAMTEKKSEKTTLYFDYGLASDNNSTELRSYGSESRRAVGFVVTKPNGVKVFNPLIMHTGNKNWVTPFELEDETKLLKKEIEELKKQLDLFKVKD